MDENSLLARVLAARGINTPEEIESFMHPDLSKDWLNPYDIDGMEELANSVEAAIRAGKKITVYGDYDLDGISATVVMMRGLRELDKHINAGMTVDYFLPSRFKEGYGITEKSLERFLAKENLPEFVITVDCGITCNSEIQALRDKGIDVVVTDHHAKSDNYPQDVCAIDPEAQDNQDENANLAGVGVALKLIDCLGARMGMPNLWRELIDFATLGTLADVMPLVGQNRALVKEGINLINEKPRASLRAMLDIAGKKSGELTSTDISYVITPRLNAAGRMDQAEIAVDLLMCDDYNQAYNLALEIEQLNNQRRDITAQVLEQANYQAKQIIENNPDRRSLVLSSKDWHPGVLGIVAAKIAETFNVASMVLKIEDGIAHGSGRSVGNVNLHDACMKSFDKFVKFGGHAGACGASVNESDIAEFSEALENYMQGLDVKEFQKTYDADLELGLHELRVDDVEELSLLEPFGNKNEYPTFLTKNVFIKRAKAVGQSHNHLSCNITDGAYGGQGIMFNVADINKYLACDEAVYIIYNPKIDVYEGRKSVKLYMKAMIPCSEISKQNKNSENANYISQLFDSFSVKEQNHNSVGDFIGNSVGELHGEIVEQKFAKDNFESEQNLDLRNKLKNLEISEIQAQVIEAMIGKDGKLHSSQQKTLDKLAEGKSVLSVMPTGRGKSLIFQVFAATMAIKENKTSIFVYPLRALISDQAFHLEKSLGKFGLHLSVLNGETPQDERDKIYGELQNNQLDIILTTPEFLAIHVDKIADVAKIGFIVIDEAHHMGQVKIGDRTAYGHMPKILEKLNSPQVLALSATVNDEVCAEIKKFLPIEEIVKDNFERANLYVDDRRNIKCRDDYLVNLCASGEKIVIYVNSRQQTVDLARMIKSRASHIAMKVGFYNAGMTKEDRKKIETLFRENELSVLVATSAFGEGVNIPDIRHVCLYHLPFSNVEFNQMAGRCGRDNNPAIVHLLYNRADASINTKILESSNPQRDILAKIFMWIKANYENLGGPFELCNDQLMQMYQQNLIPALPGAVLCALDVFSELGIINVETLSKDGSTYSKIAVCEISSKVNLEESSRFCEGQNELNNFESYRHTALRRTDEELTQLLRHPILPSELI